MAKLEMKISVLELDKVKSLIELLHRYSGSLPSELVEKIDELISCEPFVIDRDWIDSRGLDAAKIKCVADGGEIRDVLSINKFKKEVVFFSGDGVVEINPKSMTLSCGETVICEW